MNIDLYLFSIINKRAKQSQFLDYFAIICAEYLGYLLLGFLFIFALITKNWLLFFIPLASGLVSRLVITQGIYLFYQRKRPAEVLPIQSLITKPNHPSFPSGHTAFFFGLAFALFMFSLPLAIVFILASCCIALARIFCGVHWPFDIVGGIGAGLLAYLALILILRLFL